jgi:hypothetical protein
LYEVTEEQFIFIMICQAAIISKGAVKNELLRREGWWWLIVTQAVLLFVWLLLA